MRKLNLDERQVLASYAKRKSAQKVADEFGCSYQSIYRILHKHGVRRQKSNRHAKQAKPLLPCGSKKYCPLVVILLRRCLDVKPSEIVALLGYTPSAVNNIISRRCPETIVAQKRKGDFDIERMVHEYRDLDIERMVHEYRDLDMTSYELADVYGVNPATIRKWMRAEGVTIGKENGGARAAKTGSGAAVLKERCKERIERKLADDGGTLELLEYGEKLLIRCTVCGHEFEKAKCGYGHRFRCPECFARENEERQRIKIIKKHERQQQLEAAREWLLSTPRVCPECGETFYSEHENAVYCSDGCRNHARNRRNEARRRRRGCGAGSYRRRMCVKVTRDTYDRAVTLDAVYKKYRGRCCKCGCKTVRSKAYDPHRATLDHVIALANNGTHTWDNVQLLCSECNSNKRDLGQMRLAI